MGAYCNFCQTRCFVLRVIPDGPDRGRSFHLATCRDGMVHDLAKTGHTHISAINPVSLADALRASLAAALSDIETSRFDQEPVGTPVPEPEKGEN